METNYTKILACKDINNRNFALKTMKAPSILEYEILLPLNSLEIYSGLEEMNLRYNTIVEDWVNSERFGMRITVVNKDSRAVNNTTLNKYTDKIEKLKYIVDRCDKAVIFFNKPDRKIIDIIYYYHDRYYKSYSININSEDYLFREEY